MRTRELVLRPTTPWVVLAALLALVAVVIFFAGHSYSLYDDAYIYFTYAEHVVAGCGLRFRCDEPPVEGFTSPLYQAVLVAARLASSDLETVAQLVGASALVVTLAWVAALAAHPRLRPGGADASPHAGGLLGVAVALLLAADHHVLVTAVNGLETPLVMLAVTLVFAAALREDARGLRLALALAVLARPECLVLVLAAPVLAPARRGRFWPPLLGFLAGVALLRWLVFSDVAPNTYWAKAGGTREHLTLGLAYLLEAARAFPLALAAPLALLSPRARAPAGFFLAAAGVWLASFLRTGGDTFHYSRLAMPLVPVLTLLGALGLVALGERLRGVPERARRWPVVAAALAALALAVRVHAAHALPPAHGFANVQRWGEVGAFLARAHRGALVATVPVGFIAYRCECRVLDLVGLTSRAIAHGGRGLPAGLLARERIGHERHQLEWTLAQAPDLIVFGSKFAPEPFTELARTRAGFYAEWLLLQEIKAGRAPYALYSPEIEPGVYALMFRRVGSP